mgnify:FL=1
MCSVPNLCHLDFLTQAKPLPERENKFTSTLRRLSTVRKRNKTKRKNAAAKEKESNGDGTGFEPGTPGYTPSDLRPSSTTSRESDGGVETSGYFRYIYRLLINRKSLLFLPIFLSKYLNGNSTQCAELSFRIFVQIVDKMVNKRDSLKFINLNYNI